MGQTDRRRIDVERLAEEEGVESLLLMNNPFSHQPRLDGLDRLILMVKEIGPTDKEIEHWMWENARVQVRRVSREQLESWIVGSSNRGSVYWLINGDILLDRDGYLADLRARLLNWSALIKEQKLLSEFSRLVRSYLQAKQELKDGQVLDAYSNVLACLHYWAHIVLVEEGMHPELTVWEQMRKVNPGIYKLFEELTTSPETLEQRVQLVLLACEFSMMNKMETSCALLIRLIASREEPWTPSELTRHPELAGLSLDLSVLLYKLANRGCLREIAKSASVRGSGFLELQYTSVQFKKDKS
ncbi:nucleotidyltransferase-like protein [Cohnella hongkongensis]|uniref:Nucleotidyltransferase-like protein n=1 Tax=Cohnella hongkongensis TaxID=178337 RepID=A0ABV9FJX2_9BACL